MGEHQIASGNHAAVFLDRDGVLNEPFVRDGSPFPPRDLSEFKLYPDVPAGLHRLKRAGYFLVVATNQPDVGRGTLSAQAVESMHNVLLTQHPIDRVEVCYDSGRNGQETIRRKPGPGMLIDAATALGIRLERSFMVGDRWRDIDCGAVAGCKTIFIDRGYAEKLRTPPNFTARTFTEAVEIILSQSHEHAR